MHVVRVYACVLCCIAVTGKSNQFAATIKTIITSVRAVQESCAGCRFIYLRYRLLPLLYYVAVVAVVIVDIMVVVRVFQFGFSFVYFRQTFSSFRLTFKCLSFCALFWFLFFGSCYCCVAVYTTLAVARHYVVRLILL